MHDLLAYKMRSILDTCIPERSPIAARRDRAGRIHTQILNVGLQRPNFARLFVLIALLPTFQAAVPDML